MSLAAADTDSTNHITAGLWLATDDTDMAILPLSSSSSSSSSSGIEACYYVMGTSDVTIIVA